MNGHRQMCPEHRGEKAGACTVCQTQAVPAHLAAQAGVWVRPAKPVRARPARRPEPTPPDLDDVRARADREATT